MVWAGGRPRWLTAVLVVLASLVLTLLPSGPAVACSCQPTDVQEMADLAERRQGVVLDTVDHGEVTALPGRLPLPPTGVPTDEPSPAEHAVGRAGSRDDGSPWVLAGAALAGVGLTTSVLVVVRRLVVRRGRRTGGVRRPRAG